MRRPKVIRKHPKSTRKKGRRSKVPRTRKADVSRRVDNPATYSPVFREKTWQRYRILRQKWDDLQTDDPFEKLTVEQVRSAVNVYLQNRDLPQRQRDERFQHELNRNEYHQKRNAQAIKSHTKTRIQLYEDLGIDVDKIKSCDPKAESC